MRSCLKCIHGEIHGSWLVCELYGWFEPEKAERKAERCKYFQTQTLEVLME